MLSTQELKAFVPTTDAKKAEIFYRDILGLKLMSKDEYALEFDANGVSLRVTLVQDLKPQPFTIVGWNVENISAMIKSLRKKNVSFERYEFMKQDELGVWQAPSGAKIAWFKDPDGNLLSLSEIG